MGFTLEKRNTTPAMVRFAVPFLAILFTLIFCGFIFMALGFNPFTVYERLFLAALGTSRAFFQTITKMIPLILVSVGLAVAFKAKVWNIGAPGQMVAGAIAATWIGLYVFPELSSTYLIPLMFLAGFVAGAGLAGICSLLNYWINFDVVISTLLLNYIAFRFMDYLLFGPWQAGGSGFPFTRTFSPNATLPTIAGTNIHYHTLVIALFFVIVLYFGMRYTGLGFEIRVFGENRPAVEYAGMNELKILVLVMIISGGLAGLAGVGEVTGFHHQLRRGITGAGGVYAASYGYVGIFVAWLGRNDILGATIASFFVAVVLVGGQGLQLIGIPYAAVSVLMGLMLMFLMAGDLFLNYRIRRESS